MEIIVLIYALPFILGISAFLSLLTKSLMILKARDNQALVLLANSILFILLTTSIFVLGLTTIDFLIYLLWHGDQYDRLHDAVRAIQVITLSPALAVILTKLRVPFDISAGVCFCSILIMWAVVIV
jgi:hypothetical protein